MQDVRDRKIDIIVVYKVDRLTRSLADFAKLVEQFDAHDVSFVSVTQQFNTTTSMGRLTLNVLLSFASWIQLDAMRVRSCRTDGQLDGAVMLLRHHALRSGDFRSYADGLHRHQRGCSFVTASAGCFPLLL